uniref:DUF7806 domain-containing protein n=1 Tax=Arundo donax TaxID=35708 RepID=A0A0A8YZF9_ARUDO
MDKQDQLERALMDHHEDTRAKENEILRLKLLLAEKTDKNNSKATESVNRTPEDLPENSTPILPAKKIPQSNSRAKGVRLSEKAIPPCSSSEEEAQELECSGRNTCISGNGTNECPSLHMFHLLLESLVRMKISLNNGTEGFSISFFHEASGYSFTLTWLEQPGEWSYKVSDLGTLERVAVDWMKQDIRFSPNMCHVFFQQISKTITKG